MNKRLSAHYKPAFHSKSTSCVSCKSCLRVEVSNHTVKTVAVTPDAQLKAPLTIPQLPFDDFNMKPDPEAVAVYVAQVPVVYQVPAAIRHPSLLPL